MRELETELVRRAKVLAKRDGYIHDMFDGSYFSHVLVLKDYTIYLNEYGQLNVETNTRPSVMILGVTVSGLAIETSTDDVLGGAIDYLKRYTVLEDLADV